MENQPSTREIKEFIAGEVKAGKTISELMEEYIVSASFVYNALYDNGINYKELLEERKRKIREENFSKCLKLYEELNRMPENDEIKKILISNEKPSVYRSKLHKHFLTGPYKLKTSVSEKKRANSQDELIIELRKIILELGYIPRYNEIKKHSQYECKEYLKFFGGFQAALKKAGAKELIRENIRENALIRQKKELIEHLLQKRKELERIPSKKEMEKDTVHNYVEYYKIFGGLKSALRIAGVN